MTLPVRRFISTQARLGRAIQTGFPETSKRMSVASAWRVAMATMVPRQVQWSGSPVQRSVTVKSSYMVISLVDGRGWGKDRGWLLVVGCWLLAGIGTPSPPSLICLGFVVKNM